MKIEIINSIHNVSKEEWDACAFQDVTGLNPFCSYGFLSALEDSECAVPEAGWYTQNVIVRNDENNVIGVMPLYLKSHSQGEYVFDHSWANAYENSGGRYYPKLQCSIPFSPVTSPRLMVHPDAPLKTTKSFLLQGAIEHAQKCGVSSLHFTFLQGEDIDAMTSHGLMLRQDQQFHWLNNNYRSFNQFLQALSSRKRKNITKERRIALENNIEIEILKANDIQEHHWDHYFEFYLNTANRKWGRPYLNREFFSLLSERIAENIILIMAKRDGLYIAGALNLIGKDTLYGRYWGASEHHKFLHFEVCYYQAIEYAIKNNLTKVEAGAQGDHKLARGYGPVITHSAHWIENQSFKEAVENYLIQERKSVEQDVEYLKNFTPFKKEN
ncbi:MAG: N-acetyltransferase [Kordiimonadaceae bacterium]|jgi:uncharacterized protein|nr:N-acetyltransferase [Kordiimonadaceae bacterium]